MDQEVVEDQPLAPVEIPFTSLSAEAQTGVIDDFIQREGTDYGDHEASLEKKQADIRRQIEKNQVRVVFEPETESITLLTEREWRLRRRNSR